MLLRRYICIVLLVTMLIPLPAQGDVVVLRDGRKLVGVVANRDGLREEASARSHIAILEDESGDLTRLAPDKIDYIILEDDGDQYVVELTDSQGPAKSTAAPDIPRVFPDSGSGSPKTFLIVAGLAIGGVGAAVKFGGPKATITEESVDVDEDSYNTANYIMMIGGAAMVVLGLAMDDSPRSQQRHGVLWEAGPCLSPISTDSAVGLGIRF